MVLSLLGETKQEIDENAGKMKEERVALYLKLLEMSERYRRVNQYH